MNQSTDHLVKPDDILTLRQVAKLLQVHPRTVHRYIVAGLPAHQPGAGLRAPYRFERAEVLDWLRSRCSDRIAS